MYKYQIFYNSSENDTVKILKKLHRLFPEWSIMSVDNNSNKDYEDYSDVFIIVNNLSYDILNKKTIDDATRVIKTIATFVGITNFVVFVDTNYDTVL